MKSVSVRGKVIQNVLDAARLQWGEAVVSGIEPPSIGRALSALVPGAWYPVSWLVGLNDAIARHGGGAAVSQVAQSTADVESKQSRGHVASHLLDTKEILRRATAISEENFRGIVCEVLEESVTHQEREYRAQSAVGLRLWDHLEGTLLGLFGDDERRRIEVERLETSEKTLRMRVSWRMSSME